MNDDTLFSRESRADTYRLTFDLLEAVDDELPKAAAAALVSAFSALIISHGLLPFETFVRLHAMLNAGALLVHPDDKNEIDLHGAPERVSPWL